MRILVTGSSGYIGERLVAELRKRTSFDVTEFDIVDNCFKDVVNCCFNYNDYDLVYHLAALSRVNICHKDKVSAFQTNVLGTENICSVFKDKVIFFDTYLDPRTHYGYTKALGRICAQRYGSTSIRVCNIFGYDGPGVIDEIVRCVGRKETFRLQEGHCQLSFMHVDDLIRTVLGISPQSTVVQTCGTNVCLQEIVDMFQVPHALQHIKSTLICQPEYELFDVTVLPEYCVFNYLQDQLNVRK